MMKILKRKNKKGFTLMEMLIVIGIIAVLVAIAIPTFGGAKEKAEYAADVANVRAWYAEQQVKLMTGDITTAPSAYDGETLQLDTKDVRVNGSTADDFKVTYDPGKTKYETVTFGGDGVDIAKVS